MADTTRRSGRATKGQHRGLDEAEPTPPPKKGGGRGRKKQELEPEEEEEEPAIIRCICGATTEEELEYPRDMICCEQCDAWQHNECMELPNVPEKYFCEQCRPDLHKKLLKKVNRGERPWEEVQRRRTEEALELLAKKGKGKRGRKPRQSITKKEAETNGAATHDEDTVMTEGDTLYDEQIATQDAPESPQVTGSKRKHKEEKPPHSTTSSSQAEPATKLRKGSTQATTPKAPAPPPNRRKSSHQTPSKRDSNVAPLQTELVEKVEDLSDPGRQRVATALAKQFEQSVKQAIKDGSFTGPEGETEAEFALKLALSVEFAIYLNYWSMEGKVSEQYTDKFRAISFNIKANTALRDRLLTNDLSPNDLSKMSRDDMASKELQEKKAKIIKEAEKQHMLIPEEGGPRIRRTHKGEEVVDNDVNIPNSASTAEPTFTAPIRKRPSDIDTTMKDASPEPPPVLSPTPIEPQAPVAEKEEDSTQPPKDDTQISPKGDSAPERKASSTFNIQDVWSGVKPSDPEDRNRRQSRPSEPPAQPLPQQHDPDIDRLLKDDDQEEEEDYEPADFTADPNAPVWHGKMGMNNIANFSGSGKHAAGANITSIISWRDLLPPTLTIEGRIATQRAVDYLCGLRYSHTSELTVVTVTPNDNEQDKAAFDKLFTYFTGRERYGVIAKNPVTSVKDAYVIPLDSGTANKPEFIELLDDSTIEFPPAERMLLLTFVIKNNNSPAGAQQTPHPPEVGALNSPITATNHQPPPLSGHPGFQGSPPPPYQAAPSQQFSNYAGSPPQGQGYGPPHQQPTPYPNQHQPPPPYGGPTGLEAARQALGDLVNSPVVPELLQEAPNSGVVELTIVRELMERVPACRTDYGMLKGMLTQRLQQHSGL